MFLLKIFHEILKYIYIFHEIYFIKFNKIVLNLACQSKNKQIINFLSQRNGIDIL